MTFLSWDETSYDDDRGWRLAGHGLAHPEESMPWRSCTVLDDRDRDVTLVFVSNEDGFQDGIIYLSREVVSASVIEKLKRLSVQPHSLV
jgi:hypothetical protein